MKTPESCKGCGACCMVYDVIPVMFEEAVPLKYTEQDDACGSGKNIDRRMKTKDDVCIAFDRKNKICTIYHKRPEVCRMFEMGDSECLIILSGKEKSCR